MLEEVLLAGERPRELDDDVSGRGVAGVGGSVHTGEYIIHTSSVFLSTSFEADGVRERIGRRWRWVLRICSSTPREFSLTSRRD